MTIEEKIKKANQLKEDIDNIKGFLHLMEHGDKESKYDKKLNTFRYLVISANIWTGSDSVVYEQSLKETALISMIRDSVSDVIKARISALEHQLNSLFN